METFSEMFWMIYDWIREDPSTMIHGYRSDDRAGMRAYKTDHFVGIESGLLDMFRSIGD